MPIRNDSGSGDDDGIRKLWSDTRTVALVGASPRPERDSHEVFAFLLERGYRVIPVNPRAAGEEILGQRVYARLSDIDLPIDLVDVFRNSEAAGAVIDEAIGVGARAVWLQLGVVHEEAAARAEAAGLVVVMDRCPKIEFPRLGISGPSS